MRTYVWHPKGARKKRSGIFQDPPWWFRKFNLFLKLLASLDHFTNSKKFQIFFSFLQRCPPKTIYIYSNIKLLKLLVFNVKEDMYILGPRWETVLIKSLFAWTWVTASTLYLQFSMASETILKRHIRNFSWRYFLTFSIPSPGKYLICEVTSNPINFMLKLTSIIDNWLTLLLSREMLTVQY